jgi:DNA polymerase III delta subunit
MTGLVILSQRPILRCSCCLSSLEPTERQSGAALRSHTTSAPWHPPAKAGSRHRGTRHRRVRPHLFRGAPADSQSLGPHRVIYFVHGPDRLLAREAALSIAAEVDPDGSNTSWLDGRDVSFSDVASAVGAASFFGSPRVVIVSDLLVRASRDANNVQSISGDEERPGRGRAEMESLVSAVPEAHHLIVFEPSLSSVPAVFKNAAPRAKVTACEPPRGSALIAWIESAAIQSQSRIDRRAAQRLAETLYSQSWDRKASNPRYDRPPDLAYLKAEIEKLALAAHPRPITVDDIATMTPGGPDQRVFRFLDAALAGDLSLGLDELERLLAGGEEPAMLLAQLLGQIELTMVTTFAGGRTADAVARDLGTVAPGRLSAVMAATRGRAAQTVEFVATGTLADRNLKSGLIRNPEAALRHLVLALATSASQRSSGLSG